MEVILSIGPSVWVWSLRWGQGAKARVDPGRWFGALNARSLLGKYPARVCPLRSDRRGSGQASPYLDLFLFCSFADRAP